MDMTTMHKTLKRLVTAIAATAALALIPLAALASPASASAGQDHLSTNEVLQAGQYIRSSNGYWAAVQTDGNLVEYTSANHPVWATNTVQASGGTSSTTPALGTWWGTAGPL